MVAIAASPGGYQKSGSIGPRSIARWSGARHGGESYGAVSLDAKSGEKNSSGLGQFRDALRGIF